MLKSLIPMTATSCHQAENMAVDVAQHSSQREYVKPRTEYSQTPTGTYVTPLVHFISVVQDCEIHSTPLTDHVQYVPYVPLAFAVTCRSSLPLAVWTRAKSVSHTVRHVCAVHVQYVPRRGPRHKRGHMRSKTHSSSGLRHGRSQ